MSILKYKDPVTGEWRVTGGVGTGSGITEETDPTVSAWAKQPTKPTYTAKEVGALSANTKIPKHFIIHVDDNGDGTYSIRETPSEVIAANENGDIISVIAPTPAGEGMETTTYDQNYLWITEEGIVTGSFSFNRIINSDDGYSVFCSVLFTSKANNTFEVEYRSRDTYLPTYNTISDLEANVYKALDEKASQEYVDEQISSAPVNLTGAKAGQTAVVTSVDASGKPTKWEAADLPRGTFYVAFSEADGNYTADKTLNEVYTAYLEGRAVYGILSLPGLEEAGAESTIIPLCAAGEDLLVFMGIFGQDQLGIIYSSEEITYGGARLATDDTVKELTAGRLRFTGAVNTSFSSRGGDVTVRIPTVPTQVSAFTNDAGYLTQHQSLEGYAKTADLGALATKDSLTAGDVGADEKGAASAALSAAEQRIAEYGVSIKALGAKGDGTTDDTAVFQAALTANRTVHVPGGTYKLSGELAIGDNCCLELSQDTVLKFTQTSGNCIVLGLSSTLKGNHATVKVPYAFEGHVLHAFSNDSTSSDQLAVQPWSKWDPQWKTGNYVSDLNICKEDNRGFHYMVNPGECKGAAVYVSAKRASGLLTYLWGIHYTGLRIAGAFTYGIHAQNFNEGWLHEMRVDAFIDACETGVCLEDCNNTYISAIVQPRRGYTEEKVYFPYAKNGIKLIRSKNTDLSGSRVWDWTNPDDPKTDENEKTTLYANDNEYQHIAMYGNCSGTILNDYRYHDHGDTRKWIYTDTERNFDTLTILQEPITRWFKTVEGVPYYFDGNTDQKLTTQDELDAYFDTDMVKGFTDVLATATDTDGTIYNGIGYKVGYRLSTDGTIITSGDNTYTLTGFMPITVGQKMYVEGMSLESVDDACRFLLYDSDKKVIQFVAGTLIKTGTNYYIDYEETENGFWISPNKVSNNNGTAFIRFNIFTRMIGDRPMIAVDEEIKYTVEGFLADGVKVKAENVIGNLPGGTSGVSSVNGKTGTVELTASDVGALPNTTQIPTAVSQLTNDSGYITSAPVSSVNGQVGVVQLNASNVGADASGAAATAESNAKAHTNTHINNTSNPHGVTASQIGLSSETWTFTLTNGSTVTKKVAILS